MSLLRKRLEQLSAQADPKRRAERESHNLAGDGLELAARTALEGWKERPRHPDESDVFRLGYRLACHELALVFRAMRKGEPPSVEEFKELRRLVFEDAAGEQSAPSQYLDHAAAAARIDYLEQLVDYEQGGGQMPSDDHPGATKPDEEEPEQYCSMHGGPFDGDCMSCVQMSGETEESDE